MVLTMLEQVKVSSEARRERDKANATVEGEVEHLSFWLHVLEHIRLGGDSTGEEELMIIDHSELLMEAIKNNRWLKNNRRLRK